MQPQDPPPPASHPLRAGGLAGITPQLPPEVTAIPLEMPRSSAAALAGSLTRSQSGKTEGRGRERLTCTENPWLRGAGRSAPKQQSPRPLRPSQSTAATPTPQPLAAQGPLPVWSPTTLTPTRPAEDRGVFSPRSSPRCRSPCFRAPAWAPGISSLHAVPSRQGSKQPAVLGAHQVRLSRPPLLATTAQPPKGLPGTFRGLGGASALPF